MLPPSDESMVQEALAAYSFMPGLDLSAVGDVAADLRHSLQTARALADSNRPRFLSPLHRGFSPADSVGLRSAAFSRRTLLVGNGGLDALGLVAQEAGRGQRHLVIEDCPISKGYLAPLASRSPTRVEFQPRDRLAARLRELTAIPEAGDVLFVTFCDRPLHVAEDCVETSVAGGRYFLSILDALLMFAAFDRVLVLGSQLREVELADRPDWNTGFVPGDLLRRNTAVCAAALTETILGAPGRYLGTPWLATRSLKHRAVQEGARRSLVRSLLHYCQANGIPIPDRNYAEFLHRLALPAVGASARSN